MEKGINWCPTTAAEVVRNTMLIFGRPVNGAVKTKYLALLILYTLNIFHLFIGQFTYWQTMDGRFISIEDLNINAFSYLAMIEYLLIPGHFRNLVKLLESPICEKFKMSDRQKKIIQDAKKTEEFICKIFFYLSYGYAISGGLLPGLYGLYLINFGNADLIIDKEVPKAFNGWLPFSVKNNSAFLAVLGLQLVVAFFQAVFYHGWYSMILCSMLKISTKIKLLASYVDEIDERVKMDISDGTDTFANEGQLKEFFSNIVIQHINMIREVMFFNENTVVMMFLFSQQCVIEQCLVLFCIIEVQDSSTRFQFTTILVVYMCVLLFMFSFGQSIIDNSQALHLSIEQSNWIDKPGWYRKFLLITMPNSSRLLSVKSAGLYTLNRNNMLMIINAGYSYFNVMKSFKK